MQIVEMIIDKLSFFEFVLLNVCVIYGILFLFRLSEFLGEHFLGQEEKTDSKKCEEQKNIFICSQNCRKCTHKKLCGK